MAKRGNKESPNKESPIVMELLKRKDKSEAIKWLTGAPKGVHRNVGELSNADSIEYVKKLCTLGAREVVVVKIGVNGKYESTDTLIATRPASKRRRKLSSLPR